MSNPYRNVFYQQQSSWHQADANNVRQHHEFRVPYYKFYTKNWLPDSKQAKFLDLGCGAGQFLYFLNHIGYKNNIGIDLDTKSVQIANELDLNCRVASFTEYLSESKDSFDCILMLDVLEHFDREELFLLLNLVSEHLTPNGTIIFSVPNATSPTGLSTTYSDITHEISFSPTSLKELLFCHNLRVIELRDPWPAPVDLKRSIYRSTVNVFRKLESIRLKLLGLSAPDYWSPVFWGIAKKQQ